MKTRSPSSSRLATRLAKLSEVGPEYWDFADRDERRHVHSLLHYPAMMVPRLQQELIESCINWDPTIRVVGDPFVGSGTVMTEAMFAGRDFVGSDINPLAVLACTVKADCLNPKSLSSDLDRLLRTISKDCSERIEVRFPNRDKWFERHVLTGLSRIRRAIVAEPSENKRRLWWVTLAETVRLSSNSRTSTAKLHLRPSSEIVTRPNPVTLFQGIAKRNLRSLRIQGELLQDRGLIRRGRYIGRCNIRVAPAVEPSPTIADLLVTSPPYGDNHTTVAYGQASYLPLQWIERSDIVGSKFIAGESPIRCIDTASLGGSWRDALTDTESLLDRSPHLRGVWARLHSQPRDRWVRVAAYFRDLDLSLDSLLDGVRPGAVMLWTLANRSVGGERIPLVESLPEIDRESRRNGRCY